MNVGASWFKRSRFDLGYIKVDSLRLSSQE
jgi:hypothetical protein